MESSPWRSKFRFHPLPLLIVLVLVASAGFVLAQSDDVVSIVGDAELLDRVRQAHADGPRRFARGRLVAECRHGQFEVTRAEVTWDGDLARWEYELVEHGAGGPRPPRKEVHIRGRSEVVHYFEHAGSVTRGPLQSQPPTPFHLEWMLPRHWFSFQDLPLGWHEVLQPVRRASEQLKAIEVSREGNTIHVVRDSPTGMGMAIEASVDHGNLITRYQSRRSSGGMSFKGESTWRLAEDGSPILERLAWWRSGPGARLAAEPMFELRIVEFTPLASVPSSRFSHSSLELPKGTEIRTYNAGGRLIRTEHHGGRVSPDVENSLRRFADELRGGHLLKKGG